ncbi:hypothetical protein BU23DRAFT_165941 [Bimuria novae-zelandiae CBS 107.79]|uniref:Uncharacterized protein n=1 Tax=Bimuria novae-zelandiae CBS 107.79 TaxID=1447943 RepID=A0A6A5VFQ2_9PLEO|nr:hypothetical protein BU23DRAFT_165941 [Bimuria novae-zelandiae CBS 107.79]
MGCSMASDEYHPPSIIRHHQCICSASYSVADMTIDVPRVLFSHMLTAVPCFFLTTHLIQRSLSLALCGSSSSQHRLPLVVSHSPRLYHIQPYPNSRRSHHKATSLIETPISHHAAQLATYLPVGRPIPCHTIGVPNTRARGKILLPAFAPPQARNATSPKQAHVAQRCSHRYTPTKQGSRTIAPTMWSDWLHNGLIDRLDRGYAGCTRCLCYCGCLLGRTRLIPRVPEAFRIYRTREAEFDTRWLANAVA